MPYKSDVDAKARKMLVQRPGPAWNTQERVRANDLCVLCTLWNYCDGEIHVALSLERSLASTAA